MAPAWVRGATEVARSRERQTREEAPTQVRDAREAAPARMREAVREGAVDGKEIRFG